MTKEISTGTARRGPLKIRYLLYTVFFIMWSFHFLHNPDFFLSITQSSSLLVLVYQYYHSGQNSDILIFVVMSDNQYILLLSPIHINQINLFELRWGKGLFQFLLLYGHSLNFSLFRDKNIYCIFYILFRKKKRLRWSRLTGIS